MQDESSEESSAEISQYYNLRDRKIPRKQTYEKETEQKRNQKHGQRRRTHTDTVERIIGNHASYFYPVYTRNVRTGNGTTKPAKPILERIMEIELSTAAERLPQITSASSSGGRQRPTATTFGVEGKISPAGRRVAIGVSENETDAGAQAQPVMTRNPVRRIRSVSATRENTIPVPIDMWTRTLATSGTKTISDAVLAPKLFTGRTTQDPESWLDYFERYCNFRKLQPQSCSELMQML